VGGKLRENELLVFWLVFLFLRVTRPTSSALASDPTGSDARHVGGCSHEHVGRCFLPNKAL
jgi:hypothetical protein